MNPWIEGGILTLTLVIGIAIGWVAGKGLGLRMPNVPVAALVLLVGSLGGPVLTYRLMGRELGSYLVALVIAGAVTGLVFWPMGEKQGKKEWL
jgi:hypothetical protein